MKYLYLTLSIIFILFALVQFNDPDPFIWIGVYLLVALISFLAFKNKFYPIPTLIFLILCFIWAIILFPHSFADWWQMEEEAQSLKMKMPGVEEARESMGLIIAGIALLIIWFKGRKINKSIVKGVSD